MIEVAILGCEGRGGCVLPHLIETEVDVVVTGRVPVLYETAVAIEHDDIARSQHILARVREILDRPEHVQRGQNEDDPGDAGDPDALCPHPIDEAEVGCRTLRIAVGWVLNHPSRSSFLSADSRFVRKTPG